MKNMVAIADAAATVAAVTAPTERSSPLYRSNYRFSHTGFSLFVYKFNGQHWDTKINLIDVSI